MMNNYLARKQKHSILKFKQTSGQSNKINNKYTNSDS